MICALLVLEAVGFGQQICMTMTVNITFAANTADGIPRHELRSENIGR